jgi:hypothetical protein
VLAIVVPLIGLPFDLNQKLMQIPPAIGHVNSILARRAITGQPGDRVMPTAGGFQPPG